MNLYRYQNRVVLAFQWNGDKSTLCNNVKPQYIINQPNQLGIFQILPDKTLKVYTIWVNYRLAHLGDYIVYDLDNGRIPSGFVVVPKNTFKRCFQKLNSHGSSKSTFAVVRCLHHVNTTILTTHNMVKAYNTALHESQLHSHDDCYYNYYLVK